METIYNKFITYIIEILLVKIGNKEGEKMRRNIFRIISADDEGYLPSKIFDIVIMLLIIQSIISVILSTFIGVPLWITKINEKMEIISVVIFTGEYILRIWTADLYYTDMGKIKSRIKYIFSFMALVDLIAILPFYLPFVTNIDLRALRTLRLIRMVRIFKLGRYIAALHIITNVLNKKKEQLISSLFVVGVLMIISSILMYYFEHDAQPDVFQNAFSGLWWAIATLTTVGYGDIYPITLAGKVISAFIALLGIGLVAVPTGIISAGFSEEIENSKDDQYKYCPHCGNKL